jgi:hypothetical protein
MEKAIKETPKERSSSNKKNTRPFTSKEGGYKETVEQFRRRKDPMRKAI